MLQGSGPVGPHQDLAESDVGGSRRLVESYRGFQVWNRAGGVALAMEQPEKELRVPVVGIARGGFESWADACTRSPGA